MMPTVGSIQSPQSDTDMPSQMKLQPATDIPAAPWLPDFPIWPGMRN
jgi:hypothetical protein